MLHYNFLSISHRLKVTTHSNFKWDFPVWGKILAVLGSGDPQNVNFGDHFPQKACVSTEPHRLMHNTSLAKVASDLWPARGKKGGEESHKSLTNGHRVGAPPLNRPPIFFRRSNVLPDVVTPAKFGIDRLTRFCFTGGRNSLVSYT